MRKFVFFGGKGGVGKTTMSSAYAVKCARDGVRTLLVSTDPAHSTSDVFDQSFTDEPAAVADEPNLDAMEIDPETEVREHLMETKRAMGDQVSPAMVNEIDRQIEMAHQTPGATSTTGSSSTPRRPAGRSDCSRCRSTSTAGFSGSSTSERSRSNCSSARPSATTNPGG